MDCRIIRARLGKLRARLGFKQYDVVLTKEESVLTKIMSPFEGENMQTKYNILGYRIDLYFHDRNLVVEIEKNGHSGRNTHYNMKKQKGIEQEFGCKFIRIDRDKKDFDIFRTISEIFRHIKQATKKLQ